jgi:hypothetical protein
MLGTAQAIFILHLTSLLKAPAWPAAEMLLWTLMVQVQTLEQSLAGRTGAAGVHGAGGLRAAPRA